MANDGSNNGQIILENQVHGGATTINIDTTSDASTLWTPDVALGGTLAAFMNPTGVKTTSYTAKAYDYIPANATSGTVPITLPTTPPDKTTIGVKVVAVSGANTVTITAGGSDVFDKAGGLTTLTLSFLSQTVYLQYSKAAGIWYNFSQTNTVTPTNVVTLTNKRITARDSVATSFGGGSVAYNLDNYDGATISAQAAALNFVNPAGTPANKQFFNIAIKDNGSAQTLSWGTNFSGGGTNPLPLTTVAGKILILDFEYLTIDNKLHLVGIDEE